MRKNTCFCCACKFYPVRSDQLYCSKSCRQKSKRKYSELILPIKGKWFRMILDGIKKEEYRERKPYWEKRFKKYFGYNDGHFPPIEKDIIFRNGYGKNVPEFTARVRICEREGKREWGAVPGEVYYVLEIGQIFNIKNCN